MFIFNIVLTTETRECSVERSGVLTMFNGKKSTVAVPCKYWLADIQCGDYQLVVTTGIKLDSGNTFSPDTVLVNIKTTLKENPFVRTTARRLQRVSHRASFSPVTVPYPDSSVLPAQHSSDCKCLRSSCPHGLRTVQSQQSRQASKQQQQHV